MALRSSVSAVAIGAVLAACGGSAQPRRPAAERVCDRALSAAHRELGPAATMRIKSRDRADIECLVRGRGLSADVEAQASPRAWTQYDTVVVHFAQAFSGVRRRSPDMPREVGGAGPQAIWVPGQRELVATNGTESRGGCYLTVTVGGHPAPGAPSRLALATALAHATLPVAPRGSSPGPAPS